MLQALLSHSPRYRMLFATHMMCRREPDAMRRVFGAEVASDPALYGELQAAIATLRRMMADVQANPERYFAGAVKVF